MYSVKAFLIVFFFLFSHKIGLFIMLAKRSFFDFLLEFKERGISN